ncbi:hypothetical protein Tco_0509646 [Tanacetum coccineum]
MVAVLCGCGGDDDDEVVVVVVVETILMVGCSWWCGGGSDVCGGGAAAGGCRDGGSDEVGGSVVIDFCETWKQNELLKDQLLEATLKHEIETMSNLDKISKAGVDERAKLLKSLNRVSETLEADSALKEEMKNMAESNTTISSNCASISKSLKEEPEYNERLLRVVEAGISSIKGMVTKMLHAFKGMSSSTLSGNASIPTATQPKVHASVKGGWGEFGEASFSKPESKIIGSSYGPVIDITLPEQPKSPPVAPKANKGKGIATDDIESPKMLVKASNVVRPDPDELIRVPYEIHGRMCQLTNDEIQAHLDKEEKIKKVVEEAKLLTMSKPELIKVVHEEASNVEIDPKVLASAKGGQEFKKIQDVELKSPQRTDSHPPPP